jgi:hypothetical protein
MGVLGRGPIWQVVEREADLDEPWASRLSPGWVGGMVIDALDALEHPSIGIQTVTSATSQHVMEPPERALVSRGYARTLGQGSRGAPSGTS